MEIQSDSKKRNYFLIVILSSLPFFLHLYTNVFAGYGIFRDELYYIACSNKLDSGYVDQPPFSIYILYINSFLFGDSLFALRLIPAINSGLTVLFTCLMTLKLGGRKTAILISSAASIFAPVYLGINTIYSMNSFDILLWSISFYLIILVIENNKLMYWILLGIVIGIGLLNKIGFIWLGFGMLTGLLVYKRKLLLTFKPYLTVFLAIIIFSPYIIWNFQNDFAHIEFIKNATYGKYSNLDAGDFITGQFLIMNPASAVVWLSGIFYFLFNKVGKRFGVFGIIYIYNFFNSDCQRSQQS